jgi:hypothetical protein
MCSGAALQSSSFSGAIQRANWSLSPLEAPTRLMLYT